MEQHLEKCPFNTGQTWYNYEYLETKLLETSRHLTIDPENYSTWSEALADILVLTDTTDGSGQYGQRQICDGCHF